VQLAGSPQTQIRVPCVGLATLGVNARYAAYLEAFCSHGLSWGVHALLASSHVEVWPSAAFFVFSLGVGTAILLWRLGYIGSAARLTRPHTLRDSYCARLVNFKGIASSA